MKKNKSTYLSNTINSLIILLIIFSSCDEEAVSGCMDNTACNFSTEATESDDSCIYAQQNLDCDGNCTTDLDCAGNCGGTIVEDCSGQCGGTAIEDCAGVCGGSAIIDCAEECGGVVVEDCAGQCGGSSIEDECGVCGGDGPNANGCCENDIVGCTGACGDGSYVDCNDDCCEPLTYNNCLDILVNNSQTIFCEENFANDLILLTECQSLAVTTLDEFCELNFGCASIDCSGQCAGGNTGEPNYAICDCFEPNALNYWCNDDGECPPPGGTSVPSSDLLDCQDECIVATTGSYIAINPASFDNGVSVYNDYDTCCFTGCIDDNAANYDSNCTEDLGTCQYTNYFKIGEITENTLEVLFNSDQDIYGFQFSMDGLTITGASGGLADDNGLGTSTGSDSVLGFSFTGGYIPATEEQETLIILDYENLDQSSLCLPNSASDLIISGAIGVDISDQFIIHYESLCP